MAQSKIEWTQQTWNPTTGCDKLSAGCKYCYAAVMANRLKAMGQAKYANGFELTLHEDALKIPYQWKKPQIVFVNSMSDLFHEDVPAQFIKKVFEVMNNNPQHIFQVLTKRSSRLNELSPFLSWTPNIWMGVSVENQKVLYRVDDLKRSSAKVKFLSCEPLLESLSALDLTGIHWVIVGGESGLKSRPIKEEWIMEILYRCRAYQVPFFFKQWGGRNKKQNGRVLNGSIYNEYPNAHHAA